MNLPGFGDTLRATDKNTILVPIPVARISRFSSILDLLGEYPRLRSIVGNVLFINLYSLVDIEKITH